MLVEKSRSSVRWWCPRPCSFHHAAAAFSLPFSSLSPSLARSVDAAMTCAASVLHSALPLPVMVERPNFHERDRHRTGELTLQDGDGESATDSNMMATPTRTPVSFGQHPCFPVKKQMAHHNVPHVFSIQHKDKDISLPNF